jgi:DNA-binding transcriptional regulator of glucitol operon
MKMKSIFIALASAALLASCGGAKWQSYSWKRVLTNAEKNALLFKVQ